MPGSEVAGSYVSSSFSLLLASLRGVPAPPNSRQWKGFFQSGRGRLEGFSAEVIFKQRLRGQEERAGQTTSRDRCLLAGGTHKALGRRRKGSGAQGGDPGCRCPGRRDGSRSRRARQGPLGGPAAGGSAFSHTQWDTEDRRKVMTW